MTHPFPPSESTETVYLLKTQTPTQTHANLDANLRKPNANLYANPRKPYANLNLDANPTQTYANPTQTLRKPTQTSEGGSM